MNRFARVAAAAALVVLGASTASADPIVVDVLGQHFEVDPAAGTPIGNVDEVGKVVERLAGGGGPQWVNPVVGYIEIVSNAPLPPIVTLHGELANPALFSCTTPAQYLPAQPFSVTCTPQQNVNLVWDCQVLHADIQTTSAGGVGRTTMDCDNNAVAEAQTAAVSGSTGYDFQWAVQSTLVTTLVCTVDNGLNLGPVPNWRAGCGDPGVPHL